MDHLLAQIGDDARFDFDPIARSFKSKNSSARYIKNSNPAGEYGQGEGDSLTHILRGHTENVFTDPMPPIPKPNPPKSIFYDPKEILDLIDQAMNSSSKQLVNNNSRVFFVDVGRDIGYDIGGSPTRKIRIVLQTGTTDVIYTAFPH